MRQGLRSRDNEVSDQLENDDVPLRSLVPKKKKKNKRARSVLGDSDSDKELLISTRRKVGRKRKGDTSNSVVVEKSSAACRTRKRKSEAVGCEEAEVSEVVVKRSRLDVFEYNEDDLVDYKTLKKEIVEGDKRKRFIAEKKRSGVVVKKRGFDLSVEEEREVEEDKTVLLTCSLKEKYIVSSNNHTKLKGGTGNSLTQAGKKKKGDKSEILDHSEAEGKRSSRSTGRSVGRITRSSVKPKKSLENPYPPATTENNKSPKKLTAKKNKQSHLRKVEKDASLHLGSGKVKTCTSEKAKKKKGGRSSTKQLCLPTEFPEGMAVSAIKQLIADHIRKMVESAGWKVEYRPRKDRDYQDPVYVDLKGSTYWSILKAYYALEKQCENKESIQEHCLPGFSFTPIPIELLNKLKRKVGRRRKDAGHKKPIGSTKKKSGERNYVKKSKGASTNREKTNNLIRKKGSLKAKLKKDGFNLNRKNGIKRSTSAHTSDKIGKGTDNGMSKPPEASNTHLVRGRKGRRQGGYTLLARRSDKEVSSDGNQFIAYTGKRTILSWLIDSETVPLGGKVKYVNKRQTRAMLEGSIARDGINCGCCNEIVTISEFEIHAEGKLGQPCQNIFVETGVSLFQCQMDAWNKQEESQHSGFHSIDISLEDPNDDTCGICGDGGDLICCDGCPSTFHQSCLDIQVIPKGEWHCFNCCCKFCGLLGCKGGQEDDATISKLLTCSLCEEKYHVSCVPQDDTLPTESDSLCSSFCGQKCKEIFYELQKLLGVKHALEGDFSWTVIQRSNLKSDTGISKKVACNSKLALAMSVMDECFLPTIDERSGISLIHNVVYNCGSNFNRLNYSGFYTFLLERGDEIIAAASIRIHGTKFAEMPFIGTRHIYRRQGMCRRLLNAISSSLSSLNVEKLIIPAISELVHTWTTVFGFEPLEESYKHVMRSLNMLMFPGVALLQKLLLKHSSSEVLGSDLEAIELDRENHCTSDVTDDSVRVSTTPDHLGSDTTVHLTNGIICEFFTTKSLVQDTSNASNPSHVPGELTSHATEGETSCSNSQLLDEPISSAKSLLPGAEVNPSVDPDLLTSVKGAIGDAQNGNLKMDGVESDPHPSTETSSQNANDAPMEGVEFSVSTTETKFLLPEADNKPRKNCCVGSCTHDSMECSVNGVQEANMMIDGVESVADTSAQLTTVALNGCLDMHSSNEESECYSQLRDGTSTLANESQRAVVRCNGIPSVECQGHDVLPKSSDCCSEVAVHTSDTL